MKNNYEKGKEIYEELRNISKKYNISIITAMQPKRPEHAMYSKINFEQNNNIIFIDYLTLL